MNQEKKILSRSISLVDIDLPRHNHSKDKTRSYHHSNRNRNHSRVWRPYDERSFFINNNNQGNSNETNNELLKTQIPDQNLSIIRY
jgi:hypothetical protein